MSRLLSMTATAGAAASCAVYLSFWKHKHFYPSIVALYNDNLSMATIYAFVLALVVCGVRALMWVFFGALQARDYGRLHSRAWYAFTEILLALTVFRNDFNFVFVSLFGLLLTVKMFHWLMEDRIEYMQLTPNVTWKFHARLIAVTMFLSALNAGFVVYAVHSITTHGPSMQLLFAFEYFILAISVVATFLKYCLLVIDMRHAEPWDARPVYAAYLDLATDFIKLVTYVAFFFIVVNFYALPLHIIRDLFATFKSFAKRASDMVRARKALAILNRLPNPTAEDLAQDNLCSVCREEIGSGKKLPCGHVFHHHCLRSWLQLNQTCPTCRADIIVLDRAARGNDAANVMMNGNGQPRLIIRAQGHAHAHAHAPQAQAPPPPPQQQQQQPPAHAPPAHAVPQQAPWPVTPPAVSSGHGPMPHGLPEGPIPYGTPLPPPPAHFMFPPGFVPFDFNQEVAESELEQLDLAALVLAEASEREQVLKRVQYLRQFRTQLDRMLAQFGQYEQLVGNRVPAAPADQSQQDDNGLVDERAAAAAGGGSLNDRSATASRAPAEEDDASKENKDNEDNQENGNEPASVSLPDEAELQRERMRRQRLRRLNSDS